MEVMPFEGSPYLCAVVWGHWVNGAQTIIEMHAAAAEDYRGKWLSRNVINQLFRIAEFSKCKTMIAENTGEIPERIWTRFGFRPFGQYMTRDMENFDGWHKKFGKYTDGRFA